MSSCIPHRPFSQLFLYKVSLLSMPVVALCFAPAAEAGGPQSSPSAASISAREEELSEVVDDLVALSDSFARRFPPDRYHVIAVGRSAYFPARTMELNGRAVSYLPISSFRFQHPDNRVPAVRAGFERATQPLDRVERRALFAYFDTVIPSNARLGGRQIVLLDYSPENGRSLGAVSAHLKEYLRLRRQSAAPAVSSVSMLSERVIFSSSDSGESSFAANDPRASENAEPGRWADSSFVRENMYSGVTDVVVTPHRLDGVLGHQLLDPIVPYSSYQVADMVAGRPSTRTANVDAVLERFAQSVSARRVTRGTPSQSGGVVRASPESATAPPQQGGGRREQLTTGEQVSVDRLTRPRGTPIRSGGIVPLETERALRGVVRASEERMTAPSQQGDGGGGRRRESEFRDPRGRTRAQLDADLRSIQRRRTPDLSAPAPVTQSRCANRSLPLVVGALAITGASAIAPSRSR